MFFTLSTKTKGFTDGTRQQDPSYTGKQKRKAEHIEEGYEHRGVAANDAKRIAWATVNKESGGGKKSGSGRGKKESHASSRKGGKIGGKQSHSGPASAKTVKGRKTASRKTRKKAAK